MDKIIRTIRLNLGLIFMRLMLNTLPSPEAISIATAIAKCARDNLELIEKEKQND